MSTKFTKQPQDVIDYDVDLTAWFDRKDPDDDIQSVTISVTSKKEDPVALEIGPAPHPTHELLDAQSRRFKVWVGGGTDRVEYKVTCVVRTEADRVKEVEFYVKVREA